jgi:hypothetical protein
MSLIPNLEWGVPVASSKCESLQRGWFAMSRIPNLGLGVMVKPGERAFAQTPPASSRAEHPQASPRAPPIRPTDTPGEPTTRRYNDSPRRGSAPTSAAEECQSAARYRADCLRRANAQSPQRAVGAVQEQLHRATSVILQHPGTACGTLQTPRGPFHFLC